MILGIMQPYFFPYLGYFDLINYSERWIVFDTAQYIRHGWVNRNRILHPQKGWQYIIVPLKKHSREIFIRDVELNSDPQWIYRIMGQIQHYKKKAPFFGDIYRLVEDCLHVKEVSLSRLNVKILERICQYLEIKFEYEYFSEMNLTLGPVESPGDWALRISKAIGANEYVNPFGGKTIFDVSKFEDLGIRLTIRNLPPIEYQCPGYDFIPNLSILDVLMWNPPEEVKAYLDTHRN
jgi:WbqC-like protein family